MRLLWQNRFRTLGVIVIGMAIADATTLGDDPDWRPIIIRYGIAVAEAVRSWLDIGTSKPAV